MSLDLDKRQRAMLREMGIRIWQPPPVAAASEASDAIKAIAVSAHPERAEAGFEAETRRPPAAAMPTPVARAPQPAPAVPHAPAAPAALAPGLQPRPAGIERMAWPALQAAVAGCQACALCASRKNTVFGRGPSAAEPEAAPTVDWLIVGEAPGEHEDIAGEPFVGQAGQLLDNMLQAMGLQRGSGDTARAGLASPVFITNVLKCRPPSNRNPEPAEMAQCAPYLKRQVELLQPKIILALGRFAAQALLQDSLPDVQKIPLGKLRGQVHRYLGVPVVVSYHPAYLLRSLGDKAKAWDDLCLAMSVAPTVAHAA